jgi:hypothetical protein
MIPPGAYLLTVTRGPQPGESASFEVRIGPPPVLLRQPEPEPKPPSVAAAGTSDAAARVGDTTITLADVDREWQRTDPVGISPPAVSSTPRGGVSLPTW